MTKRSDLIGDSIFLLVRKNHATKYIRKIVTFGNGSTSDGHEILFDSNSMSLDQFDKDNLIKRFKELNEDQVILFYYIDPNDKDYHKILVIKSLEDFDLITSNLVIALITIIQIDKIKQFIKPANLNVEE